MNAADSLFFKVLIAITGILFYQPMAEAITYDTLTNRYAGVFPNYRDATRNTQEINELIRSIIGNHTSKTIKFSNGTYDFNVNVEGGGQLAWFENIGNLALLGAGNGNTILRWTSVNGEPQSFLYFDRNCRNISISNLTFDTTYTKRYSTGSHIKIQGSNVSIQNTSFLHAPNFSIQVGTGEGGLPWESKYPQYIHIDSNRFIGSYGDAIHVNNGRDIWIVGNYVENVGDDAFAIVPDMFNDSNSPAYQLKASGVHILSNNLNGSGWRGISIITAGDDSIGGNIEVSGNFLHGAARHGIEVLPISVEKNQNLPDSQVPSQERPRNIQINNNTIQYAGYPPDSPAHGGNFHNDADGIRLRNSNNLTVVNNTIHDIKGDGIFLEYVNTGEFGRLVQITNFGTGNIPNHNFGIQGGQGNYNIKTWFYYPGY